MRKGRPNKTNSADTPKGFGTYRIINTQTGKFYFGSCSNLRGRWVSHLSRLRGNYHSNPELQADYIIFGEGAFQFEILKEFETIEEANAYEFELISKWENKEELYNLAHTGKPNASREVPKSESHRRSISAAMIGKNKAPKSEQTKERISAGLKNSWALRKASAV